MTAIQAMWIMPASASSNLYTITFDDAAIAEPSPEAPLYFGLSLIGDFYNDDPTHNRTGNLAYNIQFTSPTPSNGPLIIGNSGVGSGNFSYAKSGTNVIGEITSSYFDMNITGGKHITAMTFWYAHSGPGSNVLYAVYSGGSLLGSSTLSESEPLVNDGFSDWIEVTVPTGWLTGLPADKVRFTANPNTAIFDSFGVYLA